MTITTDSNTGIIFESDATLGYRHTILNPERGKTASTPQYRGHGEWISHPSYAKQVYPHHPRYPIGSFAAELATWQALIDANKPREAIAYLDGQGMLAHVDDVTTGEGHSYSASFKTICASLPTETKAELLRGTWA
jgi:hypothetical protein